jgi:uncharacterized membrane protein
LLNLGAVALFALNWYVRTRVPSESLWPLVLSNVGVLGVTGSGWLGGELVYVERVGVQEESPNQAFRPTFASRPRANPS